MKDKIEKVDFKNLRESWEDFRHVCIPDFSDEEAETARNFYYSGATGCLATLMAGVNDLQGRFEAVSGELMANVIQKMGGSPDSVN